MPNTGGQNETIKVSPVGIMALAGVLVGVILAEVLPVLCFFAPVASVMIPLVIDFIVNLYSS